MKRITLIVVAVFLAGALSFGCERGQMTADTAGMEGETATAGLPTPEKAVSAATVVIGEKAWTVEIATSDEERTKGLGNRESLPAGMGMWFVFPADSLDPFWMKDTTFDLDIVFVGADMKVVDVKRDNKKLTDDLIQPVTVYRYALEIPAGEGAAVNVGDIVEYRLGSK